MIKIHPYIKKSIVSTFALCLLLVSQALLAEDEPPFSQVKVVVDNKTHYTVEYALDAKETLTPYKMHRGVSPPFSRLQIGEGSYINNNEAQIAFFAKLRDAQTNTSTDTTHIYFGQNGWYAAVKATPTCLRADKTPFMIFPEYIWQGNFMEVLITIRMVSNC